MKINPVRKPAASGSFYPDSPQALKRQIESFRGGAVKKSEILGCVLPHAGYDYSGRVAVETVSGIKIKEKIILIGPNHTGMGQAYSIMAQGTWQTPLGDVRIDEELAGRILKGSRYLKQDRLAHLHEHSLEVELPILQYFSREFKIVPITVASDDYGVLKEIGVSLGSVVRESGADKSVMFVASSDMTHYEHIDAARIKDHEAISAILDLDEDRLIRKVRELGISMCGSAPVVTMLAAVKSLGAKSARLIKYQTSGEVTGDHSAVVGYAGIVIS